ncbi:MAG: hypothetical protein JWQ81_5876 [Amycolatopsis sp.]|nr:hypothetical protein [Amycolatopsis sp.]
MAARDSFIRVAGSRRHGLSAGSGLASAGSTGDSERIESPRQTPGSTPHSCADPAFFTRRFDTGELPPRTRPVSLLFRERFAHIEPLPQRGQQPLKRRPPSRHADRAVRPGPRDAGPHHRVDRSGLDHHTGDGAGELVPDARGGSRRCAISARRRPAVRRAQPWFQFGHRTQLRASTFARQAGQRQTLFTNLFAIFAAAATCSDDFCCCPFEPSSMQP